MNHPASPLGERLTVEALAQDPYPLFQELLAHEPLCWVPAFELWLVTRRDDVLTILKDAETFTMEPAAAHISPMEDIFGPMMLSIDGPDHSRIRQPFAEPFQARHVRHRYKARIEKISHQLIDDFERTDTVDLDKGFSDKLALYTVVATLGLDVDDVSQFRTWYDKFAVALGNLAGDEAIRQAGKSTFQEFRALILAQIARLQKKPNDSILSQIVHNQATTLSIEEIVSNVALTFFGGIETTSAMLSNTVWALLSQTEAGRQVRRSPQLLPAAIEESLRWESPVQAAMRFPTCPVTLHGTTLPPGEKIYCMLGAANRDPAFFESPDTFDIHRPNAAKHLSFAYGPHFCFGGPLARLEGEVGLSILFERLPELRLHPEHPTAPYGHEFRSTPTLFVEWS